MLMTSVFQSSVITEDASHFSSSGDWYTSCDATGGDGDHSGDGGVIGGGCGGFSVGGMVVVAVLVAKMCGLR